MIINEMTKKECHNYLDGWCQHSLAAQVEFLVRTTTDSDCFMRSVHEVPRKGSLLNYAP